MKFRTLSAAALVAVVGVATAGPVLANASSTTPSATVQNSTGTLEVTAGGLIDPTTPGTTDPEDPTGPELPLDPDGPFVPNENVGSKGIIGVTNLDFGTIQIGTTTASAAAVTVDGKTRGNMVSFGDATGDYTGYTITGELTSQFTNNTTTLNGATIAFINPVVASSGEGTISVAGQTMTQTLDEDGSKTFITAAPTEGSGKWTMEFGQSASYTGAEGTADTAASSVNLAIPASVANSMTKGTYVATVTWTMGAYA